MPKLKKMVGGAMISFTLLPKQKEQLENEAYGQRISLGQLLRDKLFPKKDDKNE